MHTQHDDDDDDAVDWLRITCTEPERLWSVCDTMVRLMHAQLDCVDGNVFASFVRQIAVLRTGGARTHKYAVLMFWWLVATYEGAWCMVRETLSRVPHWRDADDALQLLHAHVDHYCERIARSRFGSDNVHRVALMFWLLLMFDVDTQHFELIGAKLRSEPQLLSNSDGGGLGSRSSKKAQQAALRRAAAASAASDGGGAPSLNDPAQYTHQRNTLGCIDDPSELLAELAL